MIVCRALLGAGLAAVTLGSLACARQNTSAPPPAQPAPAVDAAPVEVAPRAPVIDARPEASTPAAAICAARPAPDQVRRAAVNAAVAAGLGQWLHGVSIEPSLVRRRFRGWIVRSIHPGDPCYQDLELQPGDVVTKVNGKPIERPEQASEVFQSLKTADAIVVDYERGGAPRTLHIRIVP